MTTLPAAGTVRLNGTAVTAGQYVSAANIGAGLLVFHPAANANGTPYTSFTFQVQDNGGTANGGTDLDASPNTLTFNVTAVNDAPSFTKGADPDAERAGIRPRTPTSIANWATSLSPGPADEATARRADVHSDHSNGTRPVHRAPAISPTGTLPYTLKPGATGTKTSHGQRSRDNGGDRSLLARTSHPDHDRLVHHAVDLGTPSPQPGSSTVTASADAWTSQASPTQN